jgi:hypothetical protein
LWTEHRLADTDLGQPPRYFRMFVGCQFEPQATLVVRAVDVPSVLS